MVDTEILNRVKARIPDAEEGLARACTETASDRLCLRLGVDLLPRLFHSICADAAVKMYRRLYYEGISSEGAANISTTFVDDILAEYASEIPSWRERNSNSEGSGKAVRFL